MKLESESYVEGKNPVIEAVRAGRQIDKLWVLDQPNKKFDSTTYSLIKEAETQGALVIHADRRLLDKMSVTGSHQGVIARVAAKQYTGIDDILAKAEQEGKVPFLLILDGLKDAVNLGSILRIADAAGVSGVVIPKHRSVGLDAVTAKFSAGAIEYVPVAKVTNISRLIQELKQRGFWIYTTDHKAKTLYTEPDYSGPIALVIGSEDRGGSKHVAASCDFEVRIPMRGKINSLNAAVATGVVVFEAASKRK